MKPVKLFVLAVLVLTLTGCNVPTANTYNPNNFGSILDSVQAMTIHKVESEILLDGTYVNDVSYMGDIDFLSGEVESIIINSYDGDEYLDTEDVPIDSWLGFNPISTSKPEFIESLLDYIGIDVNLNHYTLDIDSLVGYSYYIYYLDISDEDFQRLTGISGYTNCRVCVSVSRDWYLPEFISISGSSDTNSYLIAYELAYAIED